MGELSDEQAHMNASDEDLNGSVQVAKKEAPTDDQELVTAWIADVVRDHQPMGALGDFVTCRCDGTVWENADWAQHVGRAAVRVIAEEIKAENDWPCSGCGVLCPPSALAYGACRECAADLGVTFPPGQVGA